MDNNKFKLELNNQPVQIELTDLPEQSNGAALARIGDTVVLVAAVMSPEPREGVNFLPLLVDYEERFYAAGKIKGGRFIKREGRPSDEAIITGRLIDRVIRPKFNQAMRNEVQVVVTVLSFDKENDPDTPALLAASTALSISNIPWDGPMAGIRLSLKDDHWIVNPSYKQREASGGELFVAGDDQKINMLEAEGDQIPEEKMAEGVSLALVEIKKLIELQKEIIKSQKPEKQIISLQETTPELLEKIKDFLGQRLEKAIFTPQKQKLQSNLYLLKKELREFLEKNTPPEKLQQEIRLADQAFEENIDKLVHQSILGKEKRPDGRKIDEVRKLDCQVGVLPRTHGSAVFSRGSTKVLATVTLDAPGKEQLLDTMEIEGSKRFMLHYNFPAFSVGEVGPMRGPGRREIGHGFLAEKAFRYLLPNKESFPYTTRVVTEVLSSNGSSSMASVCSGSMALMDAGVPLKKPAAGIAVGLMKESDENYKILTDIQGPEDHHGDMDLKVAGTDQGICALQMDVKREGITLKILKDAFAQAKKARIEILKTMSQTISQPRGDLSVWAPRIISLKINPKKIGEVIGPGGKVINEIIDKTGVEIDIEDSGLVFITSPDSAAAQKAVEWVKNIVKEVQPGEIYQGKVKRILAFGAFVEILPGQEGLVHISELASYRVNKVEDVLKIGDVIPVKVKEIDQQGRINLSLKNINQQSNR